MTAPRPPIDWARAERVATWVAARRPAPETTIGPDALADMAALAQARVAEITGLPMPATPAEVHLLDRPGWIRSNLESFQVLLGPLFERLEQRPNRRQRGRVVTAQVAGAELGALLGAMSTRVLGQYDLLVQRDASDAVYLVGPNLALIEQRYGFPSDEFRMWVLLHELTHRAQFTGVPWMRGHFTSLIDQSLSLVNPDPQAVLTALRESLRDRDEARERVRDGGVMSLIASPEQREVMRRIGGMMSLLEGHGEVTMDRAAVGLVPSAHRFGRVLRARRRRGNPLTKLLQRLIGLEAKLDQYAAGERFVTALEAQGGRALVDRCWARADNLPTLDEIRDPPLWLARVGALVA